MSSDLIILSILMKYVCVCVQLVYEDVVERAKEKEEKEAKKRQRLTKEFTDLLYDIKVLIVSTFIFFN